MNFPAFVLSVYSMNMGWTRIRRWVSIDYLKHAVIASGYYGFTMKIPLAFLGLILALLSGCTTPRGMSERALDISEPEKLALKFSNPVFAEPLASVTFSPAKVCLNCGDFWSANWMGEDFATQRFTVDYVAFLKKTLQESGIFANDKVPRLSLQATLMDLFQQSSVGASAERKNMLTSGAVLSVRATIRYQLKDRDQLLDSWDITTTATSNSISPLTRRVETIDAALSRNARALVFKMVASSNTSEAVRAQKALAALGGEVDDTRTLIGTLAYGLGKAGRVTVGAIGDGLLVVAQNSDVIAAEMNKIPGQMKELDAASRGTTVAAEREKERRNIEFQANIAAQRAPSGGDTRRSADSASSTVTRTELAKDSKPKKVADSASRPSASGAGASSSASASTSSASASSGASKSSSSSSSSSSGSAYNPIRLTVVDTSAEDAKRAKLIADAKRLADEQTAANAAAAKKYNEEKERLSKERDEKQRQWCVADSSRLSWCSCSKYNPVKGNACAR